MKILYLTSVFGDKGGSEIYTRDLIEELAVRGNKILVITTEPFKFFHKNVSFFQLPVFGHHAFHKFEAPFFYFSIIKKASEFKPDLVQSHSNSMMGFLGHMIKRKLKIPHILLIELISSYNQTFHAKVIFQTEKFLLPKLNYDKLIVWTERIKQNFLLPWGIDGKKIVILPASLKLENYNPAHKSSWVKEKYGKNLIVSMKTMWTTNVEGLKYIVKAMQKVSEKHPDWKYVIFGEGKDKHKLVSQVKELGLENNVIFGGHVSAEKAKDVLSETAIAPHSFVYEFSTSISLLEYLATGRACVVTDMGSVKEVVKDTALLVPSENSYKMAQAINRLIESPYLREELGKKARKLFKSQYTISKSVDLLEEIQNDLILGEPL